MNDLSVRVRASLWWLLPLALLVVLIGWEIGWGSAVRLRPPPAEPIAPQPVTMGLLPDYVIAGGIASHSETVNRTLFNPTRRPAPVAIAEAAKPRIQRGQYALTGTTVAGDRSLAFLKETNGGKARTVKKGETINGMLVAEVWPDRVKLTLGDESEEISLKVSTNPRPTPQPVAQAAPAAAGATAVSTGRATAAGGRRTGCGADAGRAPARGARSPGGAGSCGRRWGSTAARRRRCAGRCSAGAGATCGTGGRGGRTRPWLGAGVPALPAAPFAMMMTPSRPLMQHARFIISHRWHRHCVRGYAPTGQPGEPGQQQCA